MKHARIENGIVAEIIDDNGGDINKMFHSSIVAKLVPHKTGATINGTWDGTNFGGIPLPPLPATSKEKITRVKQIVNKKMAEAADPLDAARQIAVLKLQGERGRGTPPTGTRADVLTRAEADPRGELVLQLVIAADAIIADIDNVTDVDNDLRWP